VRNPIKPTETPSVGTTTRELSGHRPADCWSAGTDVEISFGLGAEPDGEVAVQTIGFRLP